MEELGLEYRYMARHLQGKISKEEMISELEKEIWHYAKRQFVWFKRNKHINWFKPTETEKIDDLVRNFLR
jgi:tRNA dimethylallyltransferase